MSYLLDTHALIWAVARPALLSDPVRAILDDAEASVSVSAISAYEIALKHKFGKLDVAAALLEDFEGTVTRAGFYAEPVHAGTALRAGRLTLEHRDPFDRLLAARALEANLTFLSKDEAVDVFGVRRLW